MHCLQLIRACTVILAITMGSVARGDPPDATTFNPSPSPDDLILPMPGGFKMVFRKVIVPGEDFWYNPEREITLGDASAGPEDPFSHERRVRVMGSFKDEDADHWWFPIGKYETSKAQFAAVMGDGDIRTGLTKLAQLSGDSSDAALSDLRGREREIRLAEPVRWVSWHAVQEFIHRYNAWLFADPERTRALPQFVWSRGGETTSAPGFVRLPTEIEWEYAARGGAETLRRGQGIFEKPLPFQSHESQSYAWFSENAKARVKPIGQRQPVFGLHDMLGNVSELVVDPFRAELGLGKVGGAVVRGGSVQTSLRQIRLGLRAEQPLYQEDLNAPGRMIEARSPFVGFRLAIGTLVYPDSQYRQHLVDGFKTYAASFRTNTEVLSSGVASAIMQSSVPIKGLKQRIQDLASKNPALETQTQEMITNLGQIEQLQDQEIRTVVFDLFDNTIWVAAEFGRNHHRWRERVEIALPAAERLAKLSTQHQADHQELERNTAKYQALVDQNFHKYVYFIKRIAEYGPVYLEEATKRAGQRDYLPIERDAIKLISSHVTQSQQGSIDIDAWRKMLIDELAQKGKI